MTFNHNSPKVLVLLIFLCTQGMAVFSQSGGGGNKDEDKPIISTWIDREQGTYTRGDQMFWINLGMLIPLFITDRNGDLLKDNINLGGVGSLKYSYFLGRHLFLGAELQGSFSSTIAENYYYSIPVTVHAGYQFVVGRFEFPLSVSFGGATQSYDSTNQLYGMIIKGEGSAFFRAFPEWSFGINAAWWILPQITKEPEYDATGHFLEITVAARYHF
ncbi:hypothetical protein FACS1894102_0920 [Spirochaetia bacterium]|nr:hypothetical protein FACS1894102_0920 [Spirochaetia bacterium]